MPAAIRKNVASIFPAAYTNICLRRDDGLYGLASLNDHNSDLARRRGHASSKSASPGARRPTYSQMPIGTRIETRLDPRGELEGS